MMHAIGPSVGAILAAVPGLAPYARPTVVVHPKTHRFEFGFLVPRNGGQIASGQEVRQEGEGTHEGEIELPRGVA